MKNRVEGGVIAFIGYILSPLSWWNDVFVNIPISYILSSLTILLLPRDYFPILFIIYYNFTNVLGFILMHLGTERAIKGGGINLSKKTVVKYVVVSVFYTALVYILSILGFLEPIQEIVSTLNY